VDGGRAFRIIHPVMPLATGTRLGAYEILGSLGAGGMGEVYLARDARLDRTVAVKILPPHVADDATLRQRFDREAKALAALSHPHICAVFDVGQGTTDHGAVNFLVMEHLEGETLAERLTRGALPSSDALRYGIQIADALDKAHRKGVIHRDLKPGNIMLTAGGVKLLDFGLAKIQTAPAGAMDVSAAPTLTSPLTGAGSIVGTFQYMAPEQIEGHEADARTDIFAFGAVLFEMLTGSRAFEGKSQASLIGAILEREPKPVSSLQPMSPPALDQIVKTCLAKHPENRWQSAGDIGRQLKWVLDGGSQPSAVAPLPAAPARAGRTLTGLTVAVVGIVVVAVIVWAMPRRAAPPLEVSRLTLAPSPDAPIVSVGGVDVLVAPDGRRIVYLGARSGGGNVLYMRDLNSLQSRPIAGTELPQNFGVANPFITGDGESIVFRSPGKGILSAPLRGGPPLKVADDSPRFLSGASAADGALVLALGDGLYRIAGQAGTPERLTQLDKSLGYFAPAPLPGGRAVLYHVRDYSVPVNRVFAIDLQTREEHLLANDGAAPQFSPSGHLVFARGTTLMAVPFDPVSLKVTGNPVAVQEGVQHPSELSAPDYAVSASGTLVYAPARPSPAASAVSLLWVDRAGREVGPVVSTPMVGPTGRISPDGKRLAVTHGPPGEQSQDLWVYDLDGRPPLRLAEKGANMSPVWSPDGSRIVFVSNRDGVFDLYSIPADGSTLEPVRLESGGNGQRGVPTTFPTSWLPDGRLVFSDNAGVAANSRIVAAAPTLGGKAESLVETEYQEGDGVVSPNGQWLAYTSDRSGRSEIWAQPLAGGAPVRVSSNGGNRPAWSREGRELFYREGTKMMAVRIKAGQALAFDPAVELFDRPYRPDFDVAPGGRFLMSPQPTPTGAAAASPGIVVVQNWQEELKRLVPVN